MIHKTLPTLRARARSSNDDGVALILAIIFVLTVSLVVAALLPYASAGIKTADAVRDVRTVQNAVDGAMDQAINAIRGSLKLGTSPTCSSGNTPNTYTAPDYPNPAPATGVTKVRVQYCYQPLSGSTGGDTTPPYAIQTLSEGVTIDGNAPLVVSGGILANGDVSVQGVQQTLNVDGDLYADGHCDTDVIAVGGEEHCSNTTPAFSLANDPDPSVDPLSSLALPFSTNANGAIVDTNGNAVDVDPVGACDPARDDSVVRFSPGFYSQTPQPDSTATSSTYCGSGNKHVVWWFEPGAYYFDFPDSQFTGFGDNDATFAGQNITIIGGQPLGWDPDTASAADVAGMFKNGPTSTDHSPICDESVPGSTFVFGGPTNISIGTGGNAPGQVEICAGTVGSQQISLLGARTADGASRTNASTGPVAFPEPNAASGVYQSPGNAKKIDASGALGLTNSAVAVLSGDNTTAAPNQASLSLTGGVNPFSDGTQPIPQGSLITSAKIRLVYSTSGTSSHVSNSLTYSSAVLGTQTVNLPASSQSGGESVDLTITGAPSWRALKKAVADLALTFTANGSQLAATYVPPPGCHGANCKPQTVETATSTVDGVQLEVKYIPPALETTRCLAGGSSPCNIVTNKVDDTVFLHGTVYTPQSILEVAVHNYSSTVFERGVIAYSLIAHVSASTKQTLPPFQLPGPQKQRYVRFTAQSQEPDGTWKTRLIAYVHYIDVLNRPNNKTTVAPGHRVKVLEWTVVR